jgi:hypothetical protein
MLRKMKGEGMVSILGIVFSIIVMIIIIIIIIIRTMTISSKVFV